MIIFVNLSGGQSSWYVGPLMLLLPMLLNLISGGLAPWPWGAPNLSWTTVRQDLVC